MENWVQSLEVMEFSVRSLKSHQWSENLTISKVRGFKTIYRKHVLILQYVLCNIALTRISQIEYILPSYKDIATQGIRNA